MSGDKLFGGMHDDNRKTLPATAACLFELVERGPFKDSEVPEVDQQEQGFDQKNLEVLLEEGKAIHITVRGQGGFVAATDKGMDAYLATLGEKTFAEAKRVRIATYTLTGQSTGSHGELA